jgi:hypothetical protein
MLTTPDEPITWRCDRLAADGFLGVLAGRGKEGKSWLMLALACGVARGRPIAGISCAPGRALIFDAENGYRLIKRRFHAATITADFAVQPVETGGLSITQDADWFKRTIVDYRANLVAFDSLKVLSRGAKESSSDEMEPILTTLKLLARHTGAAIVLIHHRGKADESDFRGTGVILDQADALFRLHRVKGDPEGKTRRQLVTVGCRFEEEPDPRWFQTVADRRLGLVTVDEAEPFEVEEFRPRDTVRDDVLELLGGTARSERNIAKASDLPRTTMQRILADLQEDGLAEKRPDGWVAHPTGPRKGGPPGPPPGNGSTALFEGGPQVGPLGPPLRTRHERPRDAADDRPRRRRATRRVGRDGVAVVPSR